METTSVGSNVDTLASETLRANLDQALLNDLRIPSPRVSSTANKVADFKNIGNSSTSGTLSIEDVSTVLMEEIANSDITKLSRILEPSPDPTNSQYLDSLLHRAVQEVAHGNAERAVGLLADYATRNPQRAESLSSQPGLQTVQEQIVSMVSRMTTVAKMSAEDGLSRAEQALVDNTKLSNWETNANVILKVAQRLFEAGGYANYSRSGELARLVAISANELPGVHALAASASASYSQQISTNTLLPGINLPYWAAIEYPQGQVLEKPIILPRRPRFGGWRETIENLRAAKEISTSAIRQIWSRAPLLLILMTWLTVGFLGGLTFFTLSHVSPNSALVSLGDFAFNIWAIGFLAFVGFGFYSRIRQRARY